MEKLKITDEIQITRMMIGLGSLGVEARKEECFSFIERYLAVGGNCIDTARLYHQGETDRVLGQWLKQSGLRNQIILCTKGSHNHPTGEPRLTPENIEEDLDDALRDLGTDWSDIHLLHRDNVKLPVGEIMVALDRIVKKGKARAVGVSNWTASRILEANQFAKENGLTPLCASQVQYSLAVSTPAATGDLTHIMMNDVEYGWYHESQFPVIAYSSQARGYFVKLLQGQEIKPNVQKYYGVWPENHHRAERIAVLAEKLNCTIMQLCIAYVLCGGLNTAALFNVSSLEQLGDIFDADKISLTKEQIWYLEHGEN